MRLSLSLSVLFFHQSLASSLYDPSELNGVTDPVLIARIEGYMPPICSKLYGDANHWSEWSTCSAECGTGQQVRFLNGEGQKNMVSNGCEIKQDTRECEGTLCPQDCLYTDFTAWSTCDKDTGIQVRSREIKVQAINGGKECEPLWGPPTEKQKCAVDCEGSWGDWSDCSGVTASSSRTYSATQYPLNGGQACPTSETRDCNPECQNIPWQPFGECDPVSGTHTRTRAAPIDASYVKITVALRNNKCPVVDTQPCDIDCRLGEWDRSHACDANTGTRKITRPILQPAVNCGTPCDSLQKDTLTESTETCEVHCKVSEWTKWECDKSTGVSMRTRSILQNPLNGGADCGELQQEQDCRKDECDDCDQLCETDNWVAEECSATTCSAVRTRNMLYPLRDVGKPCQLYDTQPCTLDAVMGPWTEWGECDATAHKYRTREIVSDACYGGAVAGATVERMSCQEICDANHNPWNEWGPCDQHTGEQTRSRTIVNAPTDGEQPCLTTETRTCAVNCVLDNWKDWGKCDECTGVQVRYRDVLTPMQNGGNQCGPTEESQDCAVTCMASEWTPWSEPNDECACTRTRTEISPAINGGECLLSQVDVTCPQNCEVSEWSVPGECHKDGPHAGFRLKTRSIIKKQCNGGAECPAELEQWEACDVDCVMSEYGPFESCNLHDQTRVQHREILQQSYNNGCPCGATENYESCGACADILTPYEFGECDTTTGQRLGVASYLYPPKNGQTCTLQITEDCPVNCELSDWNAGVCNTQGPLAGQQLFTRDIRVSPLNDGLECEDTSVYRDCVVDCKPADTWTAWTDCDVNGFQTRRREILWPAQHGGSNEECLVQERRACPVDCILDPDTFEVVTPSLNGGRTCQEVADANGYPGSYSTTSETSMNFLAMLSSNKSYALAAAATGGMGMMFLVGFFTTRQRNGYNTIANQQAL